MRLEITRRADLAVQAMTTLRAAQHKMKAQELAEQIGATPAFIPQVIGPLVKVGWVSSEPGPTGGYELTVRAAGVSVLEVIEQIDGPTDDGRCVVVGEPCVSQTPCVLHTAWTSARGELIRALANMPVADVEPVHPR